MNHLPESDGQITTLRLSSWNEYVQLVESLKPNPREDVFRGQSCANWHLTTTLERTGMMDSASSYFNEIARIRPEVETFTGIEFNLPSAQEFGDFCWAHDGFEQRIREIGHYLAHLRHGGFPSPLLDWTKSPYIAAYFAFRSARYEGDVAIYKYCEAPLGFKIFRNSKNDTNAKNKENTRIMSLGPTINTHPRHFRQQSRYTLCINFDGSRWTFWPHESVMRGQDADQDRLVKIIIPAKERANALRFCDRVNLNAFTLFDDEEGLLDTLSMRSFDLSLYGLADDRGADSSSTIPE